MPARFLDQHGFSLIEVMVAMVILAFSVLGVASMFQWGNQGVQEGAKGTQALAMAEARVEVKRIVPWDGLLNDDLDGDGLVDVRMQDDGTQGDAVSGDGVYSGLSEQNGIRLLWTIESIDSGALERSAMVIIKAQATYQIASRSASLETGTLRVNPTYIGMR